MNYDREELDELREIEHRFRHVERLRGWLRGVKLGRREMRPLESENLELEHPRLPRWPSGLLGDFDAVFDGFQGLTVIGGRAGAGKSQAALACALENADTDGGCSVSYFDAENVSGEIKPRIQRWYGGEAAFRQRFPLVARHRFHWSAVKDGHTFEQLFHVVADRIDSSHERVLIVLDSLQKIAKRTIPGGSLLRDTEQMLNAMDGVMQASQGAISFLVLSEVNREDGIKGGSGLYDSTMALTITPTEEESVVRLKMLKNRNGRTAGDLGLYEADWRICRLVKQ